MMRMEMKNTSVESQLHTLDLGDRQQRRKVWRALISQCHCSASHCPARPDTRALCYQTTTTSDLDLYTALPRLTPACHAPHASRCPPWPHDTTGRDGQQPLSLSLSWLAAPLLAPRARPLAPPALHVSVAVAVAVAVPYTRRWSSSWRPPRTCTRAGPASSTRPSRPTSKTSRASPAAVTNTNTVA